MLNFSLHNRVALLIDAENVRPSSSSYPNILKAASYLGKIIISRAYGDWAKEPLMNERNLVEPSKIDTFQVDRIGKNSTDYGLSNNIGEILEEASFIDTNNINIFIIVSGDQDFATAVWLLRGHGKQVIGIGSKNGTSQHMQAACNSFFTLDELAKQLVRLDKRLPIPPDEVRRFFNYFVSAYHSLQPRKPSWEFEDWIPYDQLESSLRLNEYYRDYSEKFGHYTLRQWINAVVNSMDSGFEISKRKVRRRIHLSAAHHELMVTIWLANPQPEPDKRVPLAEIYEEIARLCPHYETTFSSKTPAEWLENNYVFKIKGDHVVHQYS